MCKVDVNTLLGLRFS